MAPFIEGDSDAGDRWGAPLQALGKTQESEKCRTFLLLLPPKGPVRGDSGSSHNGWSIL